MNKSRAAARSAGGYSLLFFGTSACLSPLAGRASACRNVRARSSQRLTLSGYGPAFRSLCGAVPRSCRRRPKRSVSRPGYVIHHPVEQTQAAREGYPERLWNGPENRLRIPTLKHWLITGWYMTRNKDFEWLSPRVYLKGKSWGEKMRVGRKALIKFGVLKP